MKKQTIGLAVLVALGIAALAAQLQNYPQQTSVAAGDLVPFSQFNGGTNYTTSNIRADNLAAALAVLGGYPSLTVGNAWSGNQLFHNNVTVDGSLTLPGIGGPPTSLLFANSSFQARAVTLGANLFLDAMGNLTTVTNVGTNAIPIPVPVTYGGTGETNTTDALFNLGGARLDGTTVFPSLFDSGQPTNRPLVLEGLSTGQQLTAIAAAPGDGYALGSSNGATGGLSWFALPGLGTTNQGVTTTTGYTNVNAFSVLVNLDVNNASYKMGDTVRDWATNANISGLVFMVLGPGWNYHVTAGNIQVGTWHAAPF